MKFPSAESISSLMALSPLGVEISVTTGKNFLPIPEETKISTFNGDRASLIDCFLLRPLDAVYDKGLGRLTRNP
jgi:hypothetical protein